VVTKAAVLTRELVIGADELLLAAPRSPAASMPVMTVPSSGFPAGMLGGSSQNLDGMEKSAILRVLAQTNGHQQKAAELLGISRRTLSRKLKLYGREAARQSYAS